MSSPLLLNQQTADVDFATVEEVMIEAPKLCAFQSELNMEKNQVNPDINDENIPTDGISTLPMKA